LLLSESSQGSSSVHEVHAPQGRGRQRRQAASSPSTSPGRVLPGFHKASEVLTGISWLLLPIPSSAFAQRKVARRYRSYSMYGRAASLVEAESDGWAAYHAPTTASPNTFRAWRCASLCTCSVKPLLAGRTVSTDWGQLGPMISQIIHSRFGGGVTFDFAAYARPARGRGVRSLARPQFRGNGTQGRGD
jgi:hypothetical protein